MWALLMSSEGSPGVLKFPRFPNLFHIHGYPWVLNGGIYLLLFIPLLPSLTEAEVHPYFMRKAEALELREFFYCGNRGELIS